MMNNQTVQQSVEQILTQFKENIKKVQNDTISEIYCDLLPYFEDDLIANMRMRMIQDLKYSDEKYGYDFINIRKKIFLENREEIIRDLDQDNLNEIKRLQDSINTLRKIIER